MKPPASCARINPIMKEDAVDGAPVKENALAAVLGAIVGYIVLQHWPQIAVLIRMLSG